MYYHTCLIDNGFGSRCFLLRRPPLSETPSKVHSITFPVLQSHRLQLSATLPVTYYSFSTVFLFCFLYFITEKRFCQSFFYKFYFFAESDFWNRQFAVFDSLKHTDPKRFFKKTRQFANFRFHENRSSQISDTFPFYKGIRSISVNRKPFTTCSVSVSRNPSLW